MSNADTIQFVNYNLKALYPHNIIQLYLESRDFPVKPFVNGFPVCRKVSFLMTPKRVIKISM